MSYLQEVAESLVVGGPSAEVYLSGNTWTIKAVDVEGHTCYDVYWPMSGGKGTRFANAEALARGLPTVADSVVRSSPHLQSTPRFPSSLNPMRYSRWR